MNKFLNKKNASIALFVVILVVVIVMCTKNPISNFIFTLLSPYKIYNATSSDISLCYRTGSAAAYTYTWTNIAKNASGILLGLTNVTSILIFETKEAPLSGAPASTDVPTNPYSVSYVTASTPTAILDKPEIKLYDYTSFGTPIATTSIANVVSGFETISFTTSGAMSKNVVILDPSTVIDYSTFTDTTETVGGNSYNSITLTEGTISRYVLSVGNDNILAPASGGNLGNVSNVYSVRSTPAASGAFITTYYVAPYISSPAPTTAAYPTTYTVKYVQANVVANSAFSDITYGSKAFFYGKAALNGLFTKLGSSSTNGTLPFNTNYGNSTLAFANSVFTLTNSIAEIRYIDTFTNSSSSSQTLTFYTLKISGTTVTGSGNAATKSLNPGDTYEPTTIPYVVNVPKDIILREGLGTVIDTPTDTGRFIFRSVNNSTGADIKYVSTATSNSTPTSNLATANTRTTNAANYTV